MSADPPIILFLPEKSVNDCLFHRLSTCLQERIAVIAGDTSALVGACQLSIFFSI